MNESRQQEITKGPKHDLLQAIQHWLVSLGCIRFHGQPPQPNTSDLVAWAIILFEQSSALHAEVFEDQRSSANELRISRQCINAQLSSLLVLATNVLEQR
jgi:hypothetical protein